MALIPKNSKDLTVESTINMVVYGYPGVGKTTLGATTKKVLVADVENGAHLLGVNDIDADIVTIKGWEDMKDLYTIAKSGKYDTIVIDPIGELLDKLIEYLKGNGYLQKGGEMLTIGGWGVAKTKFRKVMRMFRDLPCHVVWVAHTSEKKDEDATRVRPKMQASLDEDICAMADIVGYLQVTTDDKGKQVRELLVQPAGKFYAKDRYNLCKEGKIVDPTMDKVIKLVEGKILTGKQGAANLEAFNNSLDEE